MCIHIRVRIAYVQISVLRLQTRADRCICFIRSVHTYRRLVTDMHTCRLTCLHDHVDVHMFPRMIVDSARSKPGLRFRSKGNRWKPGQEQSW